MKFKSIGFFIFSLLIGVWVLFAHSPNLLGRDPAAIRQHYDFTNLTGTSLDKAMRTQMLAGLNYERVGTDLMLSIGHFAFTNAKGEKKFACEQYQTVSFEFEAEGVVVNGERPSLHLKGPCQGSKSDLAMIDPLRLPIARILAEKPIEGEVDYSDLKSSIAFKNLADEWPSKWILTKISFGESANQIQIDRNEIIRYTGHPIVIDIERK